MKEECAISNTSSNLTMSSTRSTCQCHVIHNNAKKKMKRMCTSSIESSTNRNTTETQQEESHWHHCHSLVHHYLFDGHQLFGKGHHHQQQCHNRHNDHKRKRQQRQTSNNSLYDNNHSKESHMRNHQQQACLPLPPLRQLSSSSRRRRKRRQRRCSITTARLYNPISIVFLTVLLPFVLLVQEVPIAFAISNNNSNSNDNTNINSVEKGNNGNTNNSLHLDHTVASAPVVPSTTSTSTTTGTSTASSSKQHQHQHQHQHHHNRQHRKAIKKAQNQNPNQNQNNRNVGKRESGNRRNNNNNNKANKAFLKWCQATLGIQTLLEIRDFEYVNYFKEWQYQLKQQQKELYNIDYDYVYGYDPNDNGDRENQNESLDENNNNNDSHSDSDNIDIDNGPTTYNVRGLVATRDIDIGEILISVPYHALITIQTTIDHDPVLSQVLGPTQRLKYGWILSSSSSSSSIVDDDFSTGDDNRVDNLEETMAATPVPATSSHDEGTNETSQNGESNGESNGGKSASSQPLSTSDSSSALSPPDSFEPSKSKQNQESSPNVSNDSNNNHNKNMDGDNDDDGNDKNDKSQNDTSYYEIGLLTVALLYHRSLGNLSPIWFQIDALLDDAISGVEYMPIRWDMHKLQHEFDGVALGPSGDEVRRLVLSMKRDVRVMYNDIMGVLIRDHGDIFGPPASASSATKGANKILEDQGQQQEERVREVDDVEDDDDSNGDNEWMFSYEKFEWAFAIVNSRKWHLPLADLDETAGSSDTHSHNYASDHNKNSSNDNVNTNDNNHHNDNIPAAANAMPAQQPTDEFMTLQDEAIRLEYSEENMTPRPAPSPSILHHHQKSQNKGLEDDTVMRMKHSFMAPLADMLNFGPPCAKGRYNTESKAFEVIATCKFLQGQEVTFWYSDDCENVMIANYGFTHPMIPKCLSVEDWRYRSDVWRKYALSLEKSLDQIYEELYDTLEELEGCNCNTGEKSNDNNVQDSNARHDTIVPKKDAMKRKKNEHIEEEDGHSGIRRIRQHDHDDVGL